MARLSAASAVPVALGRRMKRYAWPLHLSSTNNSQSTSPPAGGAATPPPVFGKRRCGTTTWRALLTSTLSTAPTLWGSEAAHRVDREMVRVVRMETRYQL